MDLRHKHILMNSGASDTTAPTCVITCAQTSPTFTSPLNFTFTFSEVVTGFAIGDITVGNGTKLNFAGSGAVYTCDVTPTIPGAVTVDVGAGVCVDGAGNGNTAATQVSITFQLTETFNRADGAVGNGWTVPGTAAISSNALVITPTMGAELVVNGGFTAWTANNPDNWTVGGESGTNPEVSQVGTGQSHGGVGTGMCNLYGTAAEVNIAQLILTIGSWYKLGITLDNRVSGSLRFRDTSSGFLLDTNTTGVKALTGRAAATQIQATIINLPADVTIDDVSAKLLTLNTMAIYRALGFTGNQYQVLVTSKTAVSGHQFGAWAVVDSTSSPANGILVYHNGNTTVKMDKLLGGTWSNLISQSVAYDVSKKVTCKRNGAVFQLFYGDTQYGTNQTLASPANDAILNATLCGAFESDGGLAIDAFEILPLA